MDDRAWGHPEEEPVTFAHQAGDEGAVAAAEADLAERHPALATIIARCGPCTLASRRGPAGSHLEALASAIVSQQLAGRAAAAIWGRVRDLNPGGFSAATVAELEPAALRAAGLSGAKAAAIADLVQRVVSGHLDLEEVAGLDDEEVIARLSEVRGIGRWTAQMFLMFRLGRLNVWPAGDLGVRRGYAVVWGLADAPNAKALEELGEEFRPWRSVAAWYCWRAVDTAVPLAPAPTEMTETTELA
jgi:3-methyladenine DNA glycosylase/8-oxoguanine DNA glycosylase